MRTLPAPALALPALLAIAGCTAPAVEAPPTVVRSIAPRPAGAAGLERVMGQTAPAVIGTLGKPALDLREGPARKLQFRGPACTLDAYLYPPQSGGAGQATVTWIDARTPAGGDMDRASCIAALTRR